MVTLSKQIVGQHFKERRTQLGLSATRVCAICEFPHTKINQHESGQLMKNFESLNKLCAILCDDGTLMAEWIISYTQLEFLSEDALKEAVNSMKVICNWIPQTNIGVEYV